MAGPSELRLGMTGSGMAVSVWSGLLGLHGFRHGGLGAFRSGTVRSGELRRGLERRFWCGGSRHV